MLPRLPDPLTGEVIDWSYHVAPVVLVSGSQGLVPYVLDPAIARRIYFTRRTGAPRGKTPAKALDRQNSSNSGVTASNYSIFVVQIRVTA